MGPYSCPCSTASFASMKRPIEPAHRPACSMEGGGAMALAQVLYSPSPAVWHSAGRPVTCDCMFVTLPTITSANALAAGRQTDCSLLPQSLVMPARNTRMDPLDSPG